MVSFDVESLFTNIPTDETIEILLDLAFSNGAEVFHDLSRDELKKLLIICTKQSHFQFEGKFYEQVDGVAMGSPLGPLFANAFMNNFEKIHMNEIKNTGINIWLRYVDDIFATMENADTADKVLNLINTKHVNIKFTIEHEVNNQLPFLDTCVTRCVNKYSTKVYHKKTFTGTYLNWTSLTARSYKVGLIRCLINRIWQICSEPGEREIEKIKLKAILRKNDYPSEIIDSTIEKYEAAKSAVSEAQIEKVIEEVKSKRFIVLPYVSKKCEDFSRKLKSLVKRSYAQVDFNVAFQAPMTIGKLFPFKDKTKNILDKSLVVYHLKCKNCSADYIGKTERTLKERLVEHQDEKKKSACYEHEKATGHKIDYDGVKVVDNASTDFRVRIKELLHILKKKPELNKQLNSQSSYEIKTLIIKAYPQFRNKDN
jgi:hypothetical protein